MRKAIAKQSWCDAVHATAESAVAGADFVVIAAPVDLIAPLAKAIGPHLKPGAIVTDVGSVKSTVCHDSATALPSSAFFVGAHPMAGSEKTGWAHARPDLFSNRTCFVTPLPGTPPKTVTKVISFWHKLGMSVVNVRPEQHDRIVAHISHLPQALASALCSSLAKKDTHWRDFAGGGLRDTTRIAGSDPALWRVIFEQNRTEVLQALASFSAELKSFERALKRKDYRTVEAILQRGQSYRSKFKI